MSEKLNSAIAVIGIDIGKNSFHVVGHDRRGAIVLRQKWSRGQVEARLANLPPCLIGMEACVGAHHLSRKLQALGHDARLMPAKYVRPYSKGTEERLRDAEAIAEAVQRPTMKFVATKTADQLDLQALHRVRERLVGAAHRHHQSDPRLPAGARHRRAARAALPARRAADHPGHAHRCAVAPHAARHRRSRRRLAPARRAHRRPIREIETLARQDTGCERLMTVPGIGPIISSAMVAAIGTGDVFSKGRDFGAWLGLVPKQISTGDRTILGNISKRGNRYLRALFVQAAWVVLVKIKPELGALRAQVVDRGRQEAPAPQRAGDRARQQARPHRLGGARQGTRLRVRRRPMRQRPDLLDPRAVLGPSRRGLETLAQGQGHRDGRP